VGQGRCAHERRPAGAGRAPKLPPATTKTINPTQQKNQQTNQQTKPNRSYRQYELERAMLHEATARHRLEIEALAASHAEVRCFTSTPRALLMTRLP
jgi:hypothetical protein